MINQVAILGSTNDIRHMDIRYATHVTIQTMYQLYWI